jgi:hypothetical protein
MLEKRFKTEDEVQLLELWMAAPDHAKPVLPFDGAAILLRVQQAHRWLNEHGGSKKIVYGMLVTHYQSAGNTTYSLKTAQRDVEFAMRLFRTDVKGQTRWTTGFMLDSLLERYQSASRANNNKDCAFLAKEIREYMKLLDMYEQQDSARIKEPIPILATYSLEEADLQPIPNLKERVRAFNADWEKRKNNGLSSAIDAEFTEDSP